MVPPGTGRSPPIPDRIPSSEFGGDITYTMFAKEGVVGTGGNATVYRASVPEYDRKIALKEPHIRQSVPRDLTDRFRTEAETWAQLDDHDYIVDVIDWATDPHPWIALEFMDAGSLRDKIGNCTLIEGLWIGICLTRAIQHAHRHGVAHLDLKPTNVLFRRACDEGWDVPKVTDWGLAKLLLTYSSSLEGLSPRYAAPEQFDPERYGRPDDYTDIYQLGTVLYELLTGDRPFSGHPEQVMQAVLTTEPDRPSTANPELPVEIDPIFERALAKEKHARYESVLDLRRDLETLLGTLTEYTPTSEGPALPETRTTNGEFGSFTDEVHSTAGLVVDIETQGFVALGPTYFERHEVTPPVRAWRAGLGLPEVKAGYAIDRETVRNGDRVNLPDDLVERLADGSDSAVLGPPGSGKSTVCKTVACRWHEQDRGPVVYRESGTSDKFDQPSLLKRYVRRADGHSLIVVEDAMQPDANAVFEVMEALGERNDVAFLLDAREADWQDPAIGDLDARRDTYRQRVVEPVRVPRPDERECRRLLHRFEQLIDGSVELPVEELVADVRRETATGNEEDETPSPSDSPVGELLLLLHRVIEYAEPLETVAGTTPTTLVEDVRSTYETLREADTELALDVGVLVNLLNAAGLDVHPELVYALAPERDGTQIDDALAVLDSHVVFLSDDTQPVSDRTDATPYETVHGTWSAEFLAHALETEGDRSMHRRVGRCLTAVLALADDSTRREEVNWRLHGQTPYLGRMSTSPEAWADNTVTRLFSLGLEQAQLAPLFGTTEYSRIELPDACSPELRLRCIEWRGRMYIDAGSPDRAEREFRQLADTAGEVDALAERSTELRARSFRYLGKIAQKKGALQEAEEYLDRGLELARRAEAEKLEADCLNERAGVDWMRGTFDDETERQMERALDLYRDIGAVEPEIKLLQNLGLTFVQRGRFEAAGEHLDRSLVLAREIDATQSKVSGLLNEGHLAYRRGDIDTAEQHWTHALDFARESGHRQPEAILLNNLGEVARESEEYDTAEAYYTQSLDLARQIDARKSVARAHSNLALLALQRGDFATADERASESLELRREMNDQRGEAVTLRILGRLAVRRGDFAAAEERLTRSRGLTSDIDDPYLEARTVLAMGELATAREEFADARETLTEAATLAEEIGAARLTLEITDSLVDACEELDDEETLGKWCTTAVEMAREAGLEEEQQTFREAVPVDVDS